MRHSSPPQGRVHPKSTANQPPDPPPRLVAGLCDFTALQTIYAPHYRTIHITTATIKRDRQLLAQASPVPVADIVPVADAIYAELDDDREHFTILTCDAQPQIYGFKVITSGSVCHVDVPHDAVLRSALLLGARAIILLHNHPSGHLRPSPHDIMLTTRLRVLASMVDIEVIDHVTYHPTAGALSMRPFFPEIWPPDREPDHNTNERD